VRQLESLIRLSEAVARANCVEEILPRFVREAYNLLRQSIITVEKDDIDVEDEADEDAPAAAPQDGDDEMTEARDRDGDSPMGDEEEAPAAAATTRQKTKITYDKYMKILNLLVRRLNEDEAKDGQGVEQHELVTWYLERIESELNSQDDLDRERDLAYKVLKRMTKVGLPITFFFPPFFID
jgi:DNA replication licensing factor MCM6